MAQVAFELADIDARTAGTLAAVLRPVLSVGILLMIVRIVLSWYPQVRVLTAFGLALLLFLESCPLTRYCLAA